MRKIHHRPLSKNAKHGMMKLIAGLFFSAFLPEYF